MLARFLMSDGQGSAFPKVAMLASNLAVITTVPGASVTRESDGKLLCQTPCVHEPPTGIEIPLQPSS